MKDYLTANQKVYDDTAEEFREKIHMRNDSTVTLTKAFLNALKTGPAVSPYSLLELGPGSGHASQLLSEAGHSVTAIEFSKPMAVVAQETAPKAKIIHGEFLSYDFGGQTFDGILGCAFIHLFPEQDAILVVSKIKTLLRPGGIVFLATTRHPVVQEGYAVKTNFKSTEKRFRREYTPDALKHLLASNGFSITSYNEVADPEVAGKVWMNITAQRSL